MKHPFLKLVSQTDSYKLCHWNQYPDGTEFNWAYFESRLGAEFAATPFFSLQYIMMTYLEGVVVTQADVDEMKELAEAHLGGEEFFNVKGWERIVKVHGGKLPIRIKAVPEGTPITTNNILMSVENTDPKVAFITNYLESILTHVWYGSTVAALSRAVKEDIKKYLDETSDNPDAINFMLHDFGYRGVSSDESAAIGGAAHLTNFLGTDTVTSLFLLREYYRDKKEDFAGLGYSVVATEHSIMTARGKDGEEEVLDQLLLLYMKGILSCVGDSFDYENFVENLVCKKFKKRIEERDGVFVVRPDSTTPSYPTPEKLVVWTLQKLTSAFGYMTNSKGYMVLNPKVRVIWGDGIGRDGIVKILEATKLAGFSAENLVFGMGGGLLQKINRDTQCFAFKSAAQRRNGVWHDIFKQPKDLSKASKKGKQALIKVDGKFMTVPLQKDVNGKYIENPDDILGEVFLNGTVTRKFTIEEVRANASL